MNEIQTAMTQIANTIGLERVEVMEKLSEWNKQKVYPVSMIDIQISSDGVKDNAKEIGDLVGNIGAWVDEVAKNTLDAESITDAKKTVSEIGRFLIETRKIQTNPLKEIAGHFTKHEAKFKEFNEKLTKKFEEINEIEYAKRETKIVEIIQEAISEQEMTDIVGLDVFKDFIAAKRKTNIITSTGKPNKVIRDAIAEAVRVVVDPIKQAQELEARKALQSKQFESYLENVEADGSTEKLEANINALVRMKETVTDLYPDIQDHCMRSIDNKIARCEANIKANKAIAEKDAIKNADGELMATFEEIKTMSQDMTLDSETLKELANKLRAIYPKLSFAENQGKVKTLGSEFNQRIVDLEVKENTPVLETKPVVEEEVILEETKTEKYYISIHDLEFLASVGVEADSEEEAKAKFVAMLESHLNMVQLQKKGN